MVGMSITKDINSLLDDMLVIRSEINRMRADLKPNETLVNNQTGERVSANKIEELANNEINEIKSELNKLTNNGQNIHGLFNNTYYVNDMLQDKLIAQTLEDNDNQQLTT